MAHPTILALSAPENGDPAPAVAACRAGALGVFDAEFLRDENRLFAGLERLAEFTTGPFALKVDGADVSLATRLTTRLPERLEWVIVAGGVSSLADWKAALPARVKLAAEAVSLVEARDALAAGVDGLILKGQESGGRVGSETAFVLLQQWRQWSREHNAAELPVWVQGGIGLRTAAACIVGGATGVVLDVQLRLARESQLPETVRTLLLACDGSETQLLGGKLGSLHRVYTRLGHTATETLNLVEDRLANSDDVHRVAEWRSNVAATIGVDPKKNLWLFGQDAALAKPLANKFGTVGGIIVAIEQSIREHLSLAQQLQPLAPGAALAKKHGTTYPLLQGPMTRVSDTADFCVSVAAGGALPFLALALLRGAECSKLLEETKSKIGDRPWGVGLLGFIPPEIRAEQLDAVLKCKPPYAIIAGGRPDQAKHLEAQGIVTYLHVPSPGLLKMFLKDGARKFIFEGRECGGHVGPRTSFVLWESMCDVIEEHLGPNGKGLDLNVVFAGGIHDDVSAAMVATLSARLAARGVHIGGLMGTAYLFTQEAVAGGAIVPRFQQEALGCDQTVLLETG
ncbi:MAG TPA: nitronate monooxygenase, partial [Pirellulales bacterium]